MTKKLENLLDLMPEDHDDEHIDYEEVFEQADLIIQEMKNSDKIDHALTTVSGLNDHDREMDDIGAKAMNSFQQLTVLGMGCTEQNAGKIFEVAAQMLKIALEAKDAKVSRKLKTVDLMLKKEKINNESKKLTPEELPDTFDRNKVLDLIKKQSVDVGSDDINGDK